MTEKRITEADLLAAMRGQADDKAMGMPHAFSERDVADLWFRLPVSQPIPAPDDAAALAAALDNAFLTGEGRERQCVVCYAYSGVDDGSVIHVPTCRVLRALAALPAHPPAPPEPDVTGLATSMARAMTDPDYEPCHGPGYMRRGLCTHPDHVAAPPAPLPLDVELRAAAQRVIDKWEHGRVGAMFGDGVDALAMLRDILIRWKLLDQQARLATPEPTE